MNKILYKSIEKSIRQHEETLCVSRDIDEQDVRCAIRWVMRDNPDIFWFVHQYQFDSEKGIVSFRYQFSKERIELLRKSIDDVVMNDFQIGHVSKLGVYEQVMYVYKWLLSYCNYNVNSAYNQNIDSVFVRRNSVCTGYAKAAQYLFKLLGIESRLVFGRLNNDREDGRHCWNIICVEGIYYHMDVCLGYPSLEETLVKSGTVGVLRYGDFNFNCFCVSAEEIAKTRTIEDVESLPVCNNSLEDERVKNLTQITIMRRNGTVGCLLSHIGSSADIYLCARDNELVLKKFRDDNKDKCVEEYGYMKRLKGCEHLIQLNDTYTDIDKNIIAIEQATPMVDLFCSHYYRPSLRGVLLMIVDIISGWQECYERGIFYRDFHVCNIYKANDGIYKLGDFGSCRFESCELFERVGNQWFMSPETYIYGRFDERSAVYSITAVLYYILNGLRPPFVNCNNEAEALRKKMDGEPLPIPSLFNTFPNYLVEIIMDKILIRGCAYYPSKRIRSTKELLVEINNLLDMIKGHNVNMQFNQPNFDRSFDDSTLDISIPINVHNYFANVEDVESVSQTAADMCFSDTKNNGIAPIHLEDDISGNMSEAYTATVDDVENFCRTMGVGDVTDSQDSDNNSSTMSTFKMCVNGHYYLGEQCPYCPKISKRYSANAGCPPPPPFPPHLFGGDNHNKTCMFECESASYTYLTNIEKQESAQPHKELTPLKKTRFLSLFKRKHKRDIETIMQNVYGSIFAPAEVKRKSRMLIQVYLHLFEETESVKTMAVESDKNAIRRDYVPLQCNLKKGDKVDVMLNIYGETLLMSDKKSVVWQGSFTKCSFDYFVSREVDVDELSCKALLLVNGIPVGEMRFITKIVEQPRNLNPEIVAQKYKKVFISYAHKDESKVKSFHEGLKLAGIEHFFDRAYLKTGDIYPRVIQDYINSADLFVLFWSENASKSEYVQKERAQALTRAFPQVKPQDAAKLSIYPMSIEPRAELPADMKDYYHFGGI